MKSGFKIVLIYAAIAGAILLLQLFPVTGIFLMLFLAVFWITIVIHIMMVHLAVAAFAKRIARPWLVLPIAFYGSGVLLFAISYGLAIAEAKDVEAANAAAKVGVAEPYTFLLHGNDPGLIERYQIERLYQHENDISFSTWMIGRGSICNTKRSDSLIEGEYWVARADLFPDNRDARKTRQCSLTRRGLPGDADYRYEIKPDIRRTHTLLADRIDGVWAVTEEKTGAVVTKVRTARITTSSPILMAYIGCFLNDAHASWDCGFELINGGPVVTVGYKAPPQQPQPIMLNPPPVPDPEMLEISAVARALSLPLRTPTD